MATEKERKLAGELYIADNPELGRDNQRGMVLMERFNATPAPDGEIRRELLERLLGGIGDGSEIRAPMY